ncbi:TPA: hypothetical protein PCK01_004163 [Klebsiella quasipneumoniae]|nr:hypothetical protein [Klebsiella quasipneumoniae subsp. quasipneumoniae]HDG7841419.1 hypothetical protein [Klebsiella quasipneumoniae]HDG7913086.1 hypothetical protein [Klebsiella quasipneumoniae]HDG7926032.1 hypothetical protein [Klebsiella quasipneumoniae]
MHNARFIEHPIAVIIKPVEAGGTVKNVCRQGDNAEASWFNGKSKCGVLKLNR